MCACAQSDVTSYRTPNRQASQSSSTTLDPPIEELGLSLLAELTRRQMTKEQIAEAEEQMGSEEAKASDALFSIPN
jgi:hypothetical protein